MGMACWGLRDQHCWEGWWTGLHGQQRCGGCKCVALRMQRKRDLREERVSLLLISHQVTWQLMGLLRVDRLLACCWVLCRQHCSLCCSAVQC